jgi:hypothetical protein
MRIPPIGPPRFVLLTRLLSWARGAMATDYTAVPDHSRPHFVGHEATAEIEGWPRTFPAARARTERRGRPVIGTLALCLFFAAYLLVGHRVHDSHVTAETVSSAEAHPREVGSILPSNERTPARQTLSLLPDAPDAVRQSDLYCVPAVNGRI